MKSKLLLIAILAAGIMVGRMTVEKSPASSGQEATEKEPVEYTCSMHPQIRQEGPGKCPLCAMDLIPLSRGSKQTEGKREIRLSEHARALARIQTQRVERAVPEAEIRLLGRVQADESRVRSVTARFPGRIERLYVNYTGVSVRKGDHLAQIYSPELLTAQAELLSARRFADVRALRNAREKLLLWGLSEASVEEVEARGEPSDRMDIDSPQSGFVTAKFVYEGDYVDTGTVMFEITDMDAVWVVLDVYEKDKPWLRFGQEVSFYADAIPGKEFTGRIAYISPVLDEATRTFKVRVNMDNPSLLLRPGMFVTATVKARVAAGGVVIDPELEGKWISPMHPEIVKDEPGACDVCGMALVKAEELGYLAKDTDAPLLVPTSAVLITGRRALVYVEVPEQEEPTHEGREIVLGPRAGDFYLVNSGLREGELVVVNGAFKLDSTLQLQGKPSMMSESGGEIEDETVVASPEMRSELAKLLQAYFPIWRALSDDDLSSARESAGALEQTLKRLDMVTGSDGARKFWKRYVHVAEKSAKAISEATSMDNARREFEPLSMAFITLVRRVGLTKDVWEAVEQAYCPMTFEGRRADWLQPKGDLLNPYFGAEMLHCGGFEPLPMTASE